MDIQLPAVGPGVETDDEPEEELPPATVEYLDYRVVQQQGWDIDDDDLFEKAAAADLDERHYGVMEAPMKESLLRSAEDHGLKWPFQCRSGTCAMCAGVLKGGEAEMDMNLFLEDHEVEEMDLRLTCTCQPESDTVQVVFNAIQMEYVRDIAQNRG
ncbi:ferredoxin Fer [Salinigranum marinum]|jgi:ferredoxin|uniref:ferredoxin Fer n=1 Tax=Salinigranum marinum TaxID=1515595 RepID=UPI002989A397|nr:ferredoxin Fer [Salinigranum marinum]